METETVVTDAVETVATNLTLNKTVVIATAALATGVAATVIFKKVQDKVKAKLAAKRLETELTNS